MRRVRSSPAPQAGFTLIEILVTLLILAIGLMGLAGLQARMLNAQFEAYQRAQAVMLTEDMTNRLRTNIAVARATTYTATTQYGTGNSLGDTTSCTSSDDVCVWSQALKGASTKLGALNVGSMIGARGCLETVSGSATSQQVVRVTVVWQGLTPTVAPASTCGKDSYGDDRLRRAVSVDVTLAYLGV